MQQQGMAAGGNMPPNTIAVTPEEKEAIDRLVAMGFDRGQAIEAFFACDKVRINIGTQFTNHNVHTICTVPFF